MIKINRDIKKNTDLLLNDGYILPIGERTCIMGVLNITPDSFSDGGLYTEEEAALKKAIDMVKEGADIIDIGGESSRPGAKAISEEEELSRIMPVISLLKKELDVPLSVDTWKSGVAARALEKGVSVVNDITALNGDPKMAGTIARFNAAVVLMH
ncbi:MAG: dihydropteroate synthase, partial [Candidatus Omnitrophica bacterium]|nr:dihydropteroate synthase [Candidatus Omnitrophota bacterium]